MPDITLCATTECPRMYECYRAQAIPNEHWQYYADFYTENEHCGSYIRLKEEGEK